MLTRHVYKYRLDLKDEQDVEMPIGAHVLSVGEQNGALMLWALVDGRPEAPTMMRRFRIAGTGHPVHGDPGRFIGTVITAGGALVWHVWEMPEGHPSGTG